MNVGTESLQLEDANTVDTVSDSEDSLQHLCRSVHVITSSNTSESPLFLLCTLTLKTWTTAFHGLANNKLYCLGHCQPGLQSDLS